MAERAARPTDAQLAAIEGQITARDDPAGLYDANHELFSSNPLSLKFLFAGEEQ